MDLCCSENATVLILIADEKVKDQEDEDNEFLNLHSYEEQNTDRDSLLLT